MTVRWAYRRPARSSNTREASAATHQSVPCAVAAALDGFRRSLHKGPPAKNPGDLAPTASLKAAPVWHLLDRSRSLGRKRLDSRRSPDRKSTRLNSSHLGISYAVFCLKKTPSAPRLPGQQTSLGARVGARWIRWSAGRCGPTMCFFCEGSDRPSVFLLPPPPPVAA